MTQNSNKQLDWYRPGTGESWMITLTIVVSALFFGLIIGILKAISPGPFWETQSISYILTFVLPAIFIAIRSKSARESAIMTGEPPVSLNAPLFGRMGAIGAFALSGIAMLALAVVIEPTTSFIPMPDSVKAIFESAFVDTALWDAILSTCILAPIIEEVLCRGIMLRGMLRRSAPWKAIFWSAFIFAFIHLNPWQSIPAFIIGILFGWIYYRTGCLWLTVFLHCLNNSISTLLTRIFPDMGIDEGLLDILPRDTYIAVYIACLVLLCAALFLLNKYLPKKKTSNE